MIPHKGLCGILERILMKAGLVKRPSAEEILHHTDELVDEIKQDLEKLGFDISESMEITFPDYVKPWLPELFLDNKFLKSEADRMLRSVKFHQDNMSKLVQIEKEEGLVSQNRLVKAFLESDMRSLGVLESIMNKFEREKYLSKNEIIICRNRMQEFKDRIRMTVKEQNLVV